MFFQGYSCPDAQPLWLIQESAGFPEQGGPSALKVTLLTPPTPRVQPHTGHSGSGLLSCRIVWQDRWDQSGPQAVVCGQLVYLPQWEVGHTNDCLRMCLT